jgi:hypothetical protein
MKIKIHLIVFFILLSSCASTIRPIQKYSNHPDHVELGIKDSTNSTETKNTKETQNNSHTEETVRVGIQGGEHFSNNVNEEVLDNQQEKKSRIGISFGPGLNRVINYVAVLKVLERYNMAPAVVTGTGMGAIIAAMYADGMTPEAIEWIFYKYFKEKKVSRPYEKEWLKHVDQYLLSKFKDSKIENTKKKFYITLFDRNLKKAFYFDHGNIRDLLYRGLQLESNLSELSAPKFVAVFEKETFNARLMSQMGVDFTLAVDALGTKFDFDHPNEFLFGIYGRTSGRIQKEKLTFDYIVTLPLAKMNLDSNKDLPFFMKKTTDFMIKELALIKNKIQFKMDTQ